MVDRLGPTVPGRPLPQSVIRRLKPTRTGQPHGRTERPLSRVDQPLTITAITIDDTPRRPVAETRRLSILSILLLVTDTDTAVQLQGCVAAPYGRRRPADTPLYRVVENHLETFLSRGKDCVPVAGHSSDAWRDSKIPKISSIISTSAALEA